MINDEMKMKCYSDQCQDASLQALIDQFLSGASDPGNSLWAMGIRYLLGRCLRSLELLIAVLKPRRDVSSRGG